MQRMRMLARDLATQLRTGCPACGRRASEAWRELDIPGQLCAFVETIPKFISVTLPIAVALAIGLGALFTIYSALFWVDSNPERAFHVGRGIMSTTSAVFNTGRTVLNAGTDVLAEVVPQYNALAKHVVEPAVWVTLDVLSLVFRDGRHYDGIIKDESTFDGYVCDETKAASNQYCADAKSYAAKLEIVYAEGSVLADNGSTLLLSTANARRLQLTLGIDGNNAFDTGKSAIGEIPIQPLLDLLADFAGAAIVLTAELADIFYHVVYTVLEEIAVLLWNIVQVVFKALASVVMQLVSSGMLRSLLRIGVDVLVVLIIHVMLPLLFAVLNAILCLVDYTVPSDWPTQMACVEQTCFREDGNLGAEIFTTFSSVPAIGKQVAVAMAALLNPTTGRRYGGSTSDGADLPNVDTGNIGSAASTACAECFNCKIPEMRALWLLVRTRCIPSLAQTAA